MSVSEQADCRERRRAQAHEGPRGPQVSRATLSQQEAILRDEIVESWDRQMKLSRAGFERHVGHLLGRASEKLGQARTEIARGHTPP